MQGFETLRRTKAESGVALLIAIFALLLVSVVAISLVFSSGTESALDANYRSSVSAFYAAVAGLEEARSRLLPSNPYYFNAFGNQSGTVQGLGQVTYILNPLPGETVTPTDLSPGNLYADTEYQTEFGVPVTSATVQTTSSASGVAGLPAPLYKWARINAVTEKALNVDINNDGVLDATTPLYYDGTHLNLTSSGNEALEITSLAVLSPPNGSQKLVQYVVAPAAVPTFTGAVTMLGNGQNDCQVMGQGPPLVSGLDHATGAPPGNGVAGMAFNTTSDFNSCRNGFLLPNGHPMRLVTGARPFDSIPSMMDASVTSPPLDPRLDPARDFNTFVTSLVRQADQTFSGMIPSTADLGTCDATATPPVNNPKITYVTGAGGTLGPFIGCGILIVQSSLSQLVIDGGLVWNGVIILQSTATQTKIVMDSGAGSITGALVMAAAPGGQILLFVRPDSLLGGINYDSGWVRSSFVRPLRVLSFRELSQ